MLLHMFAVSIRRVLVICAIALLASLSGVPVLRAGAAAGFEQAQGPAVPDQKIAAALLSASLPLRIERQEGGVPGWSVHAADGRLLGYIASTWEVAHSVGYSGKPLDVLVGVDPQGRIAGSKLMRHTEPILTLGLSDEDIARFVESFRGIDLRSPERHEGAGGPGQPDIISRATVSSGVIRDSILRTARTLAIGRGLISGGGIDRIHYTPRSWAQLLAEGSLSHAKVTMTEASRALADAQVPIPRGDGPFVELYAGLIDPPSIGRSLLGQLEYSRVVGALGPGEVVLFVASRGVYSHRGIKWRRSGIFDRLALVQGDKRFPITSRGYRRIDELALDDAPALKERSVFVIPGDEIDVLKPFTLELTVSRPAVDGGIATMVVNVDLSLPQKYITPPPPEPRPLWQETWNAKKPTVIGVVAMLVVLTLILFFQESFVRRPKLWRRGRLAFLLVTFLWLGWGVNGQLSVVQVAAFIHSLFSGFRWETFLIEPVIFILWSFVALGLLFWGRGVYCGWLCPFGALQELTNQLAQRLKVPQIAVPHALHERLWVIKYTLFVAIIALSFYSMKDALILAEAEPFKTAISLRMIRAWPFVLFVVAILAAGLFIERFYCRYLCPLGAGLAIPAKLKIFDWLDRRVQCGRECRLCETRCTVGAIDPLGRINPNECILCLRCQVIFHDDDTCTILMRRKRKLQAAKAAMEKAKEASRS